MERLLAGETTDDRVEERSSRAEPTLAIDAQPQVIERGVIQVPGRTAGVFLNEDLFSEGVVRQRDIEQLDGPADVLLAVFDNDAVFVAEEIAVATEPLVDPRDDFLALGAEYLRECRSTFDFLVPSRERGGGRLDDGADIKETSRLWQ